MWIELELLVSKFLSNSCINSNPTLVEGVMVYNHLKDKVKSFLQPYAESGQVVGAEDIKAYFETLRGDAAAIRAAGGAALANGGGEPEGDNRQEQNGRPYILSQKGFRLTESQDIERVLGCLLKTRSVFRLIKLKPLQVRDIEVLVKNLCTTDQSKLHST